MTAPGSWWEYGRGDIPQLLCAKCSWDPPWGGPGQSCTGTGAAAWTSLPPLWPLDSLESWVCLEASLGEAAWGNLLFIKRVGKSPPACWEPLAVLIQNLHGPLSCVPQALSNRTEGVTVPRRSRVLRAPG